MKPQKLFVRITVIVALVTALLLAGGCGNKPTSEPTDVIDSKPTSESTDVIDSKPTAESTTGGEGWRYARDINAGISYIYTERYPDLVPKDIPKNLVSVDPFYFSREFEVDNTTYWEDASGNLVTIPSGYSGISPGEKGYEPTHRIEIFCWLDIKSGSPYLYGWGADIIPY
jgi:hypothetical protein